MSKPGTILVELDSCDIREIPVQPQDASLVDLLASAGLPLNTRCGKRGLCRGCEVELLNGFADAGGKRIVAPAVIKACCAQAEGIRSIRVPARSRLEHTPQVSESFAIEVPCAHQPLFSPQPGRRDTAFAVDVGTTTVVVLLLDLVSGQVLSRAGAFNQQIRFGDNVVTRIEAAAVEANRIAMQRAVVTGTIQPLLIRACERAGRGLGRIAGGVIAGNTTMLHLLTGEDPSSLGVAPFTPRFLASRRTLADEIGLSADGLASDTPIQLLPGIAAYLGADITAGIAATGMAFETKPGLLVDIGTNGEVVLQKNGKLLGCATAAGPAFEGSGLRCGTRARTGAVSALRLALNPFALDVEVIGDLPLNRADGICGSAYLDFLATGRNCGLLGENGRFQPQAWDCLPVQHRFSEGQERAVRLAAGTGSALRISEVDVALLLQAKAAIGAGIETLLDTAGIQARDLGTVHLAGGFGMHLNVAHAVTIGLLPGIRADQVRVVGNAALAGSVLALLDRTALEEMENLRSEVEVVELNLDDRFEDRYADHLMLP